MHMSPHSFTKEKCLSLQLFKPSQQHSAPTLKTASDCIPKEPQITEAQIAYLGNPLGPLLYQRSLQGICIPDKHSVLEAAQILTRLCPLSPVDLGPISFFSSPSDFILLKGKLSVYFYHEKQSIKLISSYHSG